jgi:hypothetical protein
MSGKIVLFYRHEDGRQIELNGDASKAEVWLVYPERELLESVESMDAAKEKLPEGFELDEATFMPPCPKCNEPSAMSTLSGMYVCRECDAEF